MTEDILYTDPRLAQFYDIDNGEREDFEYCRRLSAGRSVLDLGCGTGLFAAGIAAGCTHVVGVDPAAAMLDIARRRPGGDRVRWVEADARRLRLNEVFDVVVLTGHAFQVFLTPADRRAVLQTIACHLAPGGVFVFDSRNPEVEEWREWTPRRSERILSHPTDGEVVAWNDVSFDAVAAVATYETFYELKESGRLFRARSQIAFPSRDEIAGVTSEVGLAVRSWFGNWSGAPFGAGMPEIIPLGSLG